jgi:hypothetical protein
MSTATAEAPASDPITTDPEPTHGAQPPFDASVSTAAEETAPGPEAAAGAADAGVTLEVTPEPEKVGSRTISYEELERHAEQVRAAERVVANAEANWESLKEETAAAKKEYDRTVERLRAVIRSNSPDDAPLFNQPATQPAAEEARRLPPQRRSPKALHRCSGPRLRTTATRPTWRQLDIAGEVYNFNVFTVEKRWWIDGSSENVIDGVDELDFDTRIEAIAACQAIANRLWNAQHPVEPPAADDAWRSVRLDTLTPAIPPKKLQLLADHEPPIVTIGDWQAWCEKKGDPWFWKDLKGFGEGGRDAMEAALIPYWEKRQKGADAAQAADANEAAAKLADDDAAHAIERQSRELRALNNPPADDFTEDAIMPGGIKLVAVVEKHFSLNVARRTSGRYVSDYWIQVGSLDGYRKLADSPTFATHDEAAQDAIAAVRGLLGRVRSTLKGKAEKIAQEIVNALDAADGSAAKRKTA